MKVSDNKSIDKIFNKLNKEQSDLIASIEAVNKLTGKSKYPKKIKIKSKIRASSKAYFARMLSKNKNVQNLDLNYDVKSSLSGIAFNVKDEERGYVLIFKPVFGGMASTTINSTITELVPLILLINKANKNITAVKALEVIKNSINDFEKYFKKNQIFVNKQDLTAGQKFMLDFIDGYNENKLFQEKLQNALGIYKYLIDEGGLKNISKYFWGYRKKPGLSNGLSVDVPSAHKGDIFIQYKSASGDKNNVLGVSLKAGGKKTKEPQLNTYTGKLYKFFNADKEYFKLIKGFAKIISGITGTNDIYKKQAIPAQIKVEHKKQIAEYEQTNVIDYQIKYNTMLEQNRNGLINLFNKSNIVDFKQFILNEVIGEDTAVALTVVKAVGNSYEFNKNNSELKNLLPMLVTKEALPGSGKQDFVINLKDKNNAIMATMAMSTRTNKAGSEHKINQITNLAVKYNGLKG